MNLRYFFVSLAAMVVSATSWADIPAGFYNSIDGKKEGALKTALFERCRRNYQTISSYSNLPNYFRVTDVYPETNIYWDMYSDLRISTNTTFGRYFNREHSFPKSWWKQNNDVEYTTAYIDLNHLYPGEAKANQEKSNYPLGEVDPSYTPKFDNGVCKVGYPVQGQGGGATQVFEPADEFKGDFARTYFYMVTSYQDLTWNKSYMYMLQQNVYPTLNSWSVNLLLKWHREDPVSQKEIDRNEAVFSFQNNRNPYIDLPDLVEYVWGNMVGEVYHVGASAEPVGDAELDAPVNGAALEFGEVALGNTVQQKLFFHGSNIRKNLTVSVYRGDKGMFNLPVTTVSATQVNSDNGVWLTINYKPTEIGQHTARLLINGTGVDGNGTRGVELRGECLPKPTLTAPVATAASDITSDSYVANWTPAAGEVVDYFIVTRTRYNDGYPTVEEIIAEDNQLLIEEFDLSDSESYTVRSVRLGEESPESNVVFVSHSGITDMDADLPVAVYTEPGMVVVRCSGLVSPLRIYDVAGREVAYMAEAEGIVEFSLPAGVYIVAAGRGTAPAKVTVR